MAGKFGPASAVLLIDGFNMLSNKVKNLRHKIVANQEESTGLGDSWEEHTPTGVNKVEITQEGAFFDTDTNRSHTALSTSVPTSVQQAVRIVCAAFSGQTIGNNFYGILGAFSVAYEALNEGQDLTKANVDYVGTGQVDQGQIVQELEAKTADWNTESAEQTDYTLDTSQRVVPITSNSQANPSVVTTPIVHGLTSGDIILISGVSGSDADINGQQTATVISTTTFSVAVDATTSAGTGGSFVKANTTNGGVGYLQVTAVTTFTNFVGKITDSADDITYADLITFTDNVSAPFAERKTAAGTVDRYLGFDGNVTGSGSITAFCGFSRS